MKTIQDSAAFLLRISLAAGFFSATASRLDLWGKQSSGWNSFLAYTAEVNSFASKNIIPTLAVTSTILEIALGTLLFLGYKTRYAALGSAALTLLFAFAMTYSFGLKNPLDYSVFVVCTSSLLLATMTNYRWSIDDLISLNKQIHN